MKYIAENCYIYFKKPNKHSGISHLYVAMHFRQGGGGGGVNYDLYFFIVVMEGGANICQEFSTKGHWMPHTGLKCLNANFIYYATHLPGRGEGGIYYLFRIVLDDLHLQIFATISPKASVENSSAQWAIFFNSQFDFWLFLVMI